MSEAPERLYARKGRRAGQWLALSPDDVGIPQDGDIEFIPAARYKVVLEALQTVEVELQVMLDELGNGEHDRYVKAALDTIDAVLDPPAARARRRE